MINVRVRNTVESDICGALEKPGKKFQKYFQHSMKNHKDIANDGKRTGGS